MKISAPVPISYKILCPAPARQCSKAGVLCGECSCSNC